MTSPRGEEVPTRRRVVLMLLTAVISLSLCLLMAEVTVRVFKRGILFEPDPDLIRWRVPNRSEPGFSFETEDNLNGRSSEIPEEPIAIGDRPTNNLGLRMAEPVGPKPPGEHRILLLGDSYTEAMDVPYELRFDTIAERLLKDRGPEWSEWKIVNAGIQNGSPSQYLLILRRLMPLVEPDVVVVLTGSNDLFDDIAFERQYGFVFDENGVPLRLQRRVQLWLLQKSYLLRYSHVFFTRFAPSVARVLFPAWDDSLKPLDWMTLSCRIRPDAVRSFHEKTGRYLRNLAEMAGSAGEAFGVVVIHYSFSFENEPFYEPRYPGVKERLASNGCYEANARPYVQLIDGFLKTHGIHYRDTYTAFLAAKRERPSRKLWNFYDYHLSPNGHRVLASELAEFVSGIRSDMAQR